MRCITNYIRFTVSLITIILSIFIFSGVNLAYESLQNTINVTQENFEEIQTNKEETKTIDLEAETEKILREKINLQEEIWQIEIPSIGVEAPIAEGTTQEVMMEYVGHFENTNLWKRRVGTTLLPEYHYRCCPKETDVVDQLLSAPYGKPLCDWFFRQCPELYSGTSEVDSRCIGRTLRLDKLDNLDKLL